MIASTAYVVGSGPNGLTAAILLQRAGFSTTVLEAQPNVGGAMRSEQLTLPGFTHDLGSAIYPMACSSPVLRSFELERYGLEWIHSPAAMAHPQEDGDAVLLFRSLAETARSLGSDGSAYRRAVGSLSSQWLKLTPELLAPQPRIPRHPLLLARFGLLAPWPGVLTANALFHAKRSRAFYAGLAAHSIMPLEHPLSGAFGWILAISAHAVGWPLPRGGSQSVANALAAHFEALGGRIVTGTRVTSLRELRDARLILCDITPQQLLEIAGDELPDPYRRKLQRFRYGPGVFKMDYALNAPIPWKASSCALAATVHLGESLEEIAAGERGVWRGETSDRPFVLLVQQSLFDSTRAPAGAHTAWAYCHVPNGSSVDMAPYIEAQIERYAPGFRSIVLARSAKGPAEMHALNSNLIGGDIIGGALTIPQFLFRPTKTLYHTPRKGLYLCSASTPPGGGVHGMCGYFAARLALAELND